jgi:glycerol uptake facilitator-like aquaporin
VNRRSDRELSSPALARRLVAELVGTGLLVAVVVGSGIAAQELSQVRPGYNSWRIPLPPFLG